MSNDYNGKTVADRIKELRIAQGLTQMDLALKIGKKDKSSICKIEGKKNDITLKDVSRVAQALGTTQAYLMGWEEEAKERGFSDESGDIVVEVTNSPKLRKLVANFLKLNQEQQTSVINLINSMLPKKENTIQPKDERLVYAAVKQFNEETGRDVIYKTGKIRFTDSQGSVRELPVQLSERSSQSHTNSQE